MNETKGRLLNRKTQSGQVIILMAFGMIALLAVLGLAIDGGRLYYLERDAQNASDAAVMAATYALCTGADPAAVVQAGMNAAQNNGFFNDGTTMTVTVRQPTAGTLSSPLPVSTFQEVIISAEIPSYFIHLVYGGDLAVTTYALGHCSAPTWNPAVDGRAVLATATCAECGQVIHLTGSDLVIDGGLGANGGIMYNPSGAPPVCVTGPDDPTGCIGVIGPTDFYPDGGSCEFKGKDQYLTDGPNSLAGPFSVPELYHIDDYRPGGVYAEAAKADNNRYAYIVGDFAHINTSDTSQMPGTAESISIKAWFERGGLLFVEGNIDKVRFHTGLTLTMVASGTIDIKDFEGMVSYTPDHLMIFTTASNSCGDVLLSTSGTAGWDGVIYTPNGGAEVPGNSATAIGAIIARTVKIPGSHLFIDYRYDYLPVVGSPSIEVVE